MAALVTGAGGFVGGYLTEELRRNGVDVVGTSIEPRADLRSLDVLDSREVERVVEEMRPTLVYHLAAQSSAALSWKEPERTYEVNVAGTHHLLDALARHAADTRILVACTSDEYGDVKPEECPIDEATRLRPVSPYAVSKVAQEHVGKMFHQAFGLHVVITRAFMHVGPGQPPTFATADWARQIALAEAGRAAPVVKVGNLDLQREFADVRDVARAYRAVLEHGEAGEVYNVATGEAYELRHVLDVLLELADVPIAVEVDRERLRPADMPVLAGNAEKLERLTGWKPKHRLDETLRDILDHWRVRVREGTA